MADDHDSRDIVPVLYNEIGLSSLKRSTNKVRPELEKPPKPRLRRNTEILNSYEIPSREYMDFEELEGHVEFRVAPLMKQESDQM